MPLYMDIHQLHGASVEDIAKAHASDLVAQEKYGVEYRKYWFNEGSGKVFCLVDAPTAEAAVQVHREAHGLVAERIIEVQPELAEAFLGGGEANPSGLAVAPGGAGIEHDPGVRTVLFTDMVDSTALTQHVGDDAAMVLLGVHDTIVRHALAASGGHEVKHTGDGIMSSFVSAASAVRCATQIQRALAQHEAEHKDQPVMVRIGLAAGEPVEHHGDLFGSTVQLAARLCSHAEPQQVLVSNAVVELCLGKGLVFRDLGEVLLKGFEHPLRVHAVEWGETAR